MLAEYFPILLFILVGLAVGVAPVVLNEIGLAGFLAMMLFLGILVVGFVYEWMKGALEWE